MGGRHAGPDDFLLRPVAEVLGDKGQKVLARDPDRGEERCSVRGRRDFRHRSDQPGPVGDQRAEKWPPRRVLSRPCRARQVLG